MKDRFVLALDQVADAAQIGNKAFNLRFLSKQDVAVPVTLVCTADAFVRYLQGDPHIIERIRQELGKNIDPRCSYAVRSSASFEDGQDYSWAGQFSTELNVQGIDAIVQAVQNVWDSSHSPSARAYLGKIAHDLPELRMSVIVQEMVSPVISGVAFSRNPMTGLDEIVVEAVPGSGEALVQDGVTPERWVNKWGQWLCKPDEPKIDSAIIEQVIQQTRSIARTYGKPVDLEWVYDGQKLQWVQLRQITSLKNVSLYSNRIAREMMPGIIKPLVWSIQVPIHARVHGRLLQEIAGPNQIRVQDLVKAFYYQAYFNMDVIGDVLEAVGMPRDAIETMIGIDIPKDHRPPFKPTFKTVRLLPRMLAFVWRIWRYGGNLPTTIPALEVQWRSLPTDELAALSEEQLVARVERLIEMLEEVEGCNLRTQILMMTHHGILQGQLRKLGLDLESITQGSLQRSVASYDVNGHLEALHETLASLNAGVQEQIRHATFAELGSIRGAEPFRDALARFVTQFGHLSDSSSDFSAVSWGENPDRMLMMAMEYTSPKAKRTATSKLDDVKIPRPKRAFLHKLAQRTLAFQQDREEIGFLFTYGNGLMRRHLMALGAHLSRRGLIAAPGDVFYLYWDEVRTWATGGQLPSVPHELVGKRKQEIETARTVTPPSTIYGDQPAPLEQQIGDRLTGTPTSMGYYQGAAKVVRGLEDFQKLRRGDILVIPYSDIGWTPLFAQAGAVIAESGGMLSHSSIVAREYNIPAVVSVPGACSLTDGMTVTVDGYKGEIIIHRPH